MAEEIPRHRGGHSPRASALPRTPAHRRLDGADAGAGRAGRSDPGAYGMTEIPAPEWYASEYVVSCLPREHLAFRRFSLKVQWHAAGQWTVHVNGALVDIHGKVWAI